jgi:hypothetical protein
MVWSKCRENSSTISFAKEIAQNYQKKIAKLFTNFKKFHCIIIFTKFCDIDEICIAA